jgi:hypothetical protein
MQVASDGRPHEAADLPMDCRKPNRRRSTASRVPVGLLTRLVISLELEVTRAPAIQGVRGRYSLRSACMGSIRLARQAGIRQATAATIKSVAATAAKTIGSRLRVS